MTREMGRKKIKIGFELKKRKRKRKEGSEGEMKIS